MDAPSENAKDLTKSTITTAPQPFFWDWPWPIFGGFTDRMFDRRHPRKTRKLCLFESTMFLGACRCRRSVVTGPWLFQYFLVIVMVVSIDDWMRTGGTPTTWESSWGFLFIQTSQQLLRFKSLVYHPDESRPKGPKGFPEGGEVGNWHMERVWLCGKMKKSRVAHNNLNLHQFMAILMSIKWSWTRRNSWVFPIVCGHLTQIAADFRSNFTPEPGKLHQIALHTLPVVGSTTENNARVFPTLIWLGGFKWFQVFQVQICWDDDISNDKTIVWGWVTSEHLSLGWLRSQLLTTGSDRKACHRESNIAGTSDIQYRWFSHENLRWFKGCSSATSIFLPEGILKIQHLTSFYTIRHLKTSPFC